MKKAMLVLLALVMVLSIAACASNNGNKANTDAVTPDGSTNAATTNDKQEDVKDEKEPVTLRVAWWGGQPRHDYTLEVIKMYELKNPHVKIEPEYASWDDYWKKLAPQAAANELPDIMQMDLSYLAQYGGKGQLEDLNSYLGNGINVSSISDGAVSGGMLNGELFGFNLGVNALQVHYDPELLKKIGVDSIDPNWTWDDYKELGKKAADAGLYLETGLRPEVFFGYYLRQKGQHLYAADGTQLGYTDDQLFIDFFNMTTDMVKIGASPTPDVSAQVKGAEDDPMVKGNAVSIFQWSNQYVGVHQVANRPIEMHPLPGPNGKEGLYLKPSMFFSVSKNSKQKEEAAKFIDFFVNDIEANKLIKGDRGVPVSSVVQEGLKPLLSEENQKVFDYIAWAEKNSSVGDPPDPIGTAEIINLFTTYNEQMKYDKISVADAAKQFREEANAILAKNKK
ncbi:MAG: extracellular solute-binding protein [Paenibacillaceae bacterium]